MIHHGNALDVLRTMPEASVQMCVTSPPYFRLRDYGVDGQIGMESTLDEYISRLVSVFSEVRRILKPDGVCWLNIGDSYAGSWGSQGRQGHGLMTSRSVVSARQIAASQKKKSHTGSITKGSGMKPKDLMGVPWTLAFALRSDGWWLRQDVIWAKPNPMPESVKDRCTKAHEYLFMLTKSAKYYYNADAIAEPVAESTPARYNRSRSDDHKYSDGGPGDQTIAKSFEFLDKQSGHGRRHAGFNEREFSRDPRAMRNRRSVWVMSTLPTPEAHFATFPIDLAQDCILAGSRPGDTVIDPFSGAGTTWLACLKHGREFVGIELNAEYIKIAEKRVAKYNPLFRDGAA